MRALYAKENRLEAKVDAGIREVRRRRPTAPRPRSASTRARASGCDAIGAKISAKKLRRYVPIFEEHAVDHDLLAEGARNLRDYFQSQGYFDAEVEFKQQARRRTTRPAIDYLVNTGERHKLVAIEIAGNRYFDTDAIRERMFLQTRLVSAVSARALQREPAAPRRGFHRRTCTSPTDSAT